MRTTLRSLPTLALLGLALAWAQPARAEWQDVATISSTLGNTTGRLCVGGTGTDIGCPSTTPLLDTAAGLLTVPTDLRVTGNLYVSGSQIFEGVTFANGGISSSGTISASSFAGDGSGITNIDAANLVGLNLDRITSSSQAGVTANSSGYISLTTGGVTGTAYFTPTGMLVNAGISATGPVSATEGYISNTLAVGMPVRNLSR